MSFLVERKSCFLKGNKQCGTGFGSPRTSISFKQLGLKPKKIKPLLKKAWCSFNKCSLNSLCCNNTPWTCFYIVHFIPFIMSFCPSFWLPFQFYDPCGFPMCTQCSSPESFSTKCINCEGPQRDLLTRPGLEPGWQRGCLE